MSVLGSQLSYILPPYRQLIPIAVREVPRLTSCGTALFWSVGSDSDDDMFTALQRRYMAVPLIVTLPAPHERARCKQLIDGIPLLYPRAILDERITLESAVRRLARRPERLSRAVLEFLDRTDVYIPERVRMHIRQMLDHAAYTTSVRGVTARLNTSRRTLGRDFSGASLPPARDWLAFARLLHVVCELQESGSTIQRVACKFGYPDPYTLSNQMLHTLGVRPTQARGILGWEWVVLRWVHRHLRHDNAVGDGL